ncbi:hypothetical protein BKA62DRAFT_771689 [Auriculariales sp. MPI-PUGE-AT-0066]|nr:hypothetical protein BKA62DRAFT_771689 [Auriculariales sp. MPI-PUGE-AT-0066]
MTQTGNLPEDILIIVFDYVRLDCVNRSDPLSDIIAYPDLLSCSRVCRLWADAVPHALYRDIRVRVEIVRVGPARRLMPSNWNEFSQLKRTLSRFTASASQSRVLNRVESLQIDVQFQSSVDKEVVGPPAPLVPENAHLLDQNPTHTAPFCNLEDLADVISLLPRLRSLFLIARPSSNSQEQGPIHPSCLPSKLRTSLSALTLLTHLRLECDKYMGRSPPWAWPEFMTACPSVTHFELNCRTEVWAMWPPNYLQHGGTAKLQMLNIGYRDERSDMERLAPLCSHLRTLILRLTTTDNISGLVRVMPRNLRTLGLLFDAKPEHMFHYSQRDVVTPRLAMNVPTQLTTLIVRSGDRITEEVIYTMPHSVRRLAIELAGSESEVRYIPQGVLWAIAIRSEQLDVIHAYPPCSLSPEDHGAHLWQLKHRQLQELASRSSAEHPPISIRLSTRPRGPWLGDLNQWGDLDV